MSTQRRRCSSAFLLLLLTTFAPLGTRAADSYADLYRRAYDAYTGTNFSRAEQLALRAAKLALDAVVPDKTEQFSALDLAGLSAQALGQYDRAITHHAAAVALIDRRRDPLVWASANEAYARALGVGGQPAKAEGLLRQIITLRTDKLGPEHTDTLRTRILFANSLQRQSRYEDAAAENKDILKTLQRALGPDHSLTVGVRENLAGLQDTLGKHPEAEAELRAILKIRERDLGPEHPETLRSRKQLAAALQLQDKLVEAETHLRAVLENQQRVLGPEDKETLDTRDRLALLLFNKGKSREAVAEYQAILDIQLRTLGPEHADTLHTRGGLGASLAAQKDYKAAELQYREALKVQEKKLPPEDPALLDTLFSIAGCQSQQPPLPGQIGLRTTKDDQFQEAREFASRAYEGAHKTLGITNDITRKYLKLYGWFLEQKEKDQTGELNERRVKSIGARPGTVIVRP